MAFFLVRSHILDVAVTCSWECILIQNFYTCSALQKMRSMERTLSKASRAYSDCTDMVNSLRSMANNAENQAQLQRNQATRLTELVGRTTPKGLHCLSMKLTADYFTLEPEQQVFPNQQNIYNPDLLHYAVFSDNVLAAAVVVNSTISNTKVIALCVIFLLL